MKHALKGKNGIRPMVSIIMIVMLMLTLSAVSCKKNDSEHEGTRPPDITIKTDSLDEYDVQIYETRTLSHGVKGWNLKENELYVGDRDLEAREYMINIQDFDTLEVKRTLHLPMGDMQSPTSFYSPTHFEYVDGRYYVVDQFSKIVVYDRDFKFLYASMYNQIRQFIDFFKWNDRTMFVIAGLKYGKNMRGSEIQLFSLEDRRKPVRDCYITSYPYKIVPRRDPSQPKYRFETPIAPSTFGFERNGKIYYNSLLTNVFRIYDLKTRKITKIELAFLKPKKFTDKEVSEFAYRFGGRYEASFKKRFGWEMVYKAYPIERYYFALLDVGKGKIGFVGDIDLEKNKYRLDIVDYNTYSYVNSIWFPIGSGFYALMEEDNHGVNKSFYDVDKRIFIWGDRVGEERDYVMHISRYKLEPISMKEKLEIQNGG